MAKGKNNQIKIKHMTEKELFELQAKSLEELLKEARKVQKSLSRIKEKNKNNETLLKLKKKLEAHHTKNKQGELKEIENYKAAMKDARARMNEGAEDIIAEQKEEKRQINMDKAPYVEKMKILDRMINEKEYKI